MLPAVTPQLLANTGLRALRLAIADPARYAIEGKVDGVRGLVTFEPGSVLGTRNRCGERRQWLRGQPLEGSLRRLGNRLPILWHRTVLDGELVADGSSAPCRHWWAPSATARRCAMSCSTFRYSRASISARCLGRSAAGG